MGVVVTIVAGLRPSVVAVLGAIGFCTRVPLGTSEAAWRALTERPWAMVLAAYPLGGAVAISLVPPVSPATTALLLPLATVAVAGITHLDGLADVADAAVVHGDVERRRSVLLDSAVGVGASVALGLALVGLALAGLALASVPIAGAVAVVVSAEVGAKLGMVSLAGVGPPTFGDLGSQLEHAGPATALVALLLAIPAAVGSALLLGATAGVASTVALLAGPLAALAIGRWASARLGGVNGDCFGATNEVARLIGLHLGLAVLGLALPGSPSAAAVGVVA